MSPLNLLSLGLVVLISACEPASPVASPVASQVASPVASPVESNDPTGPSALHGQGPLVETLRRAAAEFDVSADVLFAAAYSESRLRHRDAEKEGRGLFKLDDAAILRAASLLGVAADEVTSDLETHVRAMAVLMAEARAAESSSPLTIIEALGRTRERPVSGALLVDGVEGVLSAGVSFNLDGDLLLLEPSTLTVTRQANRPDQPGVPYIQSTNYQNSSRGRGDVDTVVIHVTQGSYAGTISWFQNPASDVSTHYVVRSRDGATTQMVEEEDVAWHASCWNGRSVGIEHEGFVDDPAWFTEEMYRASARLTAGICDRWGIPKDRAHIKGHVQLSDCNNHSDPGRHWDWDHYISLVRGEGGGPEPMPPVPMTGELLGFVREGDLHDATRPIGGARVSIEGGGAQQSGADGLYRFAELMPGLKVLHVSAEGFEPATLEREVMAGGVAWGSVGLRRLARVEVDVPSEVADALGLSDASDDAAARSADFAPREADVSLPVDAAVPTVPPRADAASSVGQTPSRSRVSHSGGCSTARGGSDAWLPLGAFLAALPLLAAGSRPRRRRVR